MRYWTYGEIKDKVQKDLGLEQEEIVRTSEMMAYCNEAIDEAEAEIHTLYEDYFLTSASISLVTGTSLYSLPTNIYAAKIRGINYINNDLIYPVRRIREMDRFEDIDVTALSDTSRSYRYLLVNDSASTGMQLKLTPASRETLTNGLKVWYIRNANRMTADADICDIPEFTSFVIQYMKFRCYEKEGDPRAQLAQGLLEQQRTQLNATLSSMVPDGDNQVEMDLTFYEDMV